MALDIDSANLKTFGLGGGILVLKMLAMILLTIAQRFRKKVMVSPEDVFFIKEATFVNDDPDVERVRRAYLNDLENVLPWFLATWLWLGTGPATWLVNLLIPAFVVSRILHGIVYAVLPLPQPTRAIIFFVGFLITGYTAVATVVHYIVY